MRLLLLSISFSLISLSSYAQMNQGDSAYSSQNFQEAINAYTQLIADNHHSAELYYNLGNAYYKNNEIGKSIWAYHKAKKINPSHPDIEYNLNFVSNLTKDKIEQSKMGISHWFTQVLFGRSINFWAWMSIIMSVLCVLFIYTFKNAIHRSFKTMYLIISIVCGVAIITCIGISIAHKNHITSIDHGIIINPVVKVFTAPGNDQNVSFELHEGAKFRILKTESDWVNIELGKNQGWVEKNSVLLY